MTAHHPIGVRLADRHDDGTAQVIVFCCCGDVASTTSRYQVSVHGEGNDRVTGTPSLDWPGHFHAGAPLWELPLVDWAAGT